MTTRQVRGFLSGAGLWNPQVQFQITPLFWGLSAFISHKKIACQVGPIAVSIWFTFQGWKTNWEVLK